MTGPRLSGHRTRFAPSPTGGLHLGHALAALTAFDAARGGEFILRIEDLDRERCRAEHEAAICADLSWLGIGWREPLLRQSSREQAYREALALLAVRGVTYPCFCTRAAIRAELARAGEAPHAVPGPLSWSGERYPGICRGLSHEERQRRIARGEAHAIRLDLDRAMAQAGPLEFRESGGGPAGERGVISVRPQALGDIVLARKGLPAAYHLAVVIDDAFQGITLVTRGEDLFDATHIQRLLQALLQLPMPHYAHHRLIRDAQGQRLSKRAEAPTLQTLREQGVTSEEIRRRLNLPAARER